MPQNWDLIIGISKSPGVIILRSFDWFSIIQNIKYLCHFMITIEVSIGILSFKTNYKRIRLWN
jgi:hypothetical protein